MRLIDADALKKEVENLVAGGAEKLKDYYENGTKSDENSWIGGVYDAWELIGDAPTVELFCSYLSDGEVRQPCVEAPCNHERPQGKWVIEHDWVHCFPCGHEQNYPSNFCPNCGAQMKGGAE